MSSTSAIEPVLKARCDRASNSFHQILLPETIKTLRQQFGRLIRSAEDRGFVLVMDQLKPQKSYYNKIKENMPPAAIVEKPFAEVFAYMRERFLEWGYELFGGQ